MSFLPPAILDCFKTIGFFFSLLIMYFLMGVAEFLGQHIRCLANNHNVVHHGMVAHHVIFYFATITAPHARR